MPTEKKTLKFTFLPNLMRSHIFPVCFTGAALALTGQRNQWGVSTLYDITEGWFPAVFWKVEQAAEVKDVSHWWNRPEAHSSKTPVGLHYATHLPVFPVAHGWTGLSSPICYQYQKTKRRYLSMICTFLTWISFQTRLLEPITPPELDSKRGHRRRLIPVTTPPAWLWL